MTLHKINVTFLHNMILERKGQEVVAALLCNQLCIIACILKSILVGDIHTVTREGKIVKRYGRILNMGKIGIATDSNSGIDVKEAERLGVMMLPMPFYVDDICCYENVTLSREQFFEKMSSGADVKTSQPSPAAVLELWDQALETFDELVYIPMSSGLSGSYMSAVALAQDEPYEGRVFVVDMGRVSTPMYRSVLDAMELIESGLSGSYMSAVALAQDEPYEGRVFVVDMGRVSTPMYRSVLDAMELIEEGYSAKEIREILESGREDMVIYVAVETLEYLKKGGRISGAAEVLGNLLNIKPVLRFDVGKLDTYKKCRGFHKAKKTMIEAMHQEIEGHFKEAYEAGELYLMAATSTSDEETEKWVEEIKEAFPGMEVLCTPLPLSLCCHIGQGGVGIGCSSRPKRPVK